VRVIVSGPKLDLPARARVLDVRTAPTVVVTAAGADPQKVAWLRRRGVDVARVPGRRGDISAVALMRTLGGRGITSLLVEGGGTVAGDLLLAGLVDRIAWFVAPAVLGSDAAPAVSALGIDRVAAAVRLEHVDVARAGDDVVVTGSVRPKAGGRPFASTWPPR
jgi:diaminohydroxyphosphoribosylaminopyrimidine deaminase/5-amino-6-(5-phosphoribosylamino)uracil reductase